MRGSLGELGRRVGVAALGIPIAVGFAYLGGYPLAIFLGLLGAVGAWEFSRMHRARGVAAPPLAAGLLALAYVVMAVVAAPGAFAGWAAPLTLAVAAAVMLRRGRGEARGLEVMVTLFAALYAGAPLAFAVWLRGLGGQGPDAAGAAILLLPVGVTWIGDTAAYFTGHAVGRHRLAPSISPGKTWEGAVAGFLATALGAWLYVAVTRPLVPWSLDVVGALAFGALVAVAGQIGDLFESRFKRDCRVKDSSRLLPGHGGALDRLDSLLFVFPVAYTHLLHTGL